MHHWRKLSAVPHGVKIPDLDEIKQWGGGRWTDLGKAKAHASMIIANPVDARWMTLMGGVGTGKTMLLLAMYGLLRPYAVYLGAGDLTSAIFNSFGKDGDTEELTEELARVPVLLLDDYGVDTANKTVQNKITQIIDLRYRLRKYRPTVIATNLNKKELIRANSRVASRILDQDLVDVHSIRLPDYRRRSEVDKPIVVDRSSQK